VAVARRPIVGLFEPELVFGRGGRVRRASDPEQVVRALEANANLETDEPRRTMVGGKEAIAITVRPRPLPAFPEMCVDVCVPVLAIGPVTVTVEPSTANRLVLVRSGDRSLAFLVNLQPGSRYADDVDAMLRSVRFGGGR